MDTKRLAGNVNVGEGWQDIRSVIDEDFFNPNASSDTVANSIPLHTPGTFNSYMV